MFFKISILTAFLISLSVWFAWAVELNKTSSVTQDNLPVIQTWDESNVFAFSSDGFLEVIVID